MFFKAIASCLGIGFIKGGGTIAALVTCVVIYFLIGQQPTYYPFQFFAITVAITVIGIYTGDKVEANWGKDSSRVVIDEVAGMMVSLVFLPHTVVMLAGGLILFRFFDIVKPLGIRRMEELNGGLGVMADDILAGVYSNIILQLCVLAFKL